MRIGLFGGSFDPIHLGHLILAEHCREAAKLDEVWFVPCALQPLKQAGAQGTDRQRTEMIQMAIGGHESFVLSKIELERGGVSYTVDTLKQIHDQHPDAELFLLMGDDSLESFANWRSPETICDLATPLVVNRPGSGDVDLTMFEPFASKARMAEIQQRRVESPKIEISSSEIRTRAANENSIRYLTPRAIEKYVETQKLYAKN